MAEKLSREQRRAQLISIGVQMLSERSISEFSVDVVARQAGISRTLLFHYFDTKLDYLTTVIQHAAAALLEQIQPPEDGAGIDRMHDTMLAYLRFVVRRRTNYLAVFHAPTLDPTLAEVVEEIYQTLTLRLLAAVGVEEPTVRQQMLARATVASLETMALNAERYGTTPEELADLVSATFRRLVAEE